MRSHWCYPIAGNRHAGGEFHFPGVLCRQRHARVHVAVDHLRIVEPTMRKSVILSNNQILPSIGTSGIRKTEFHTSSLHGATPCSFGFAILRRSEKRNSLRSRRRGTQPSAIGLLLLSGTSRVPTKDRGQQRKEPVDMVEYALINSLVTGVSFLSFNFQQMVNGLVRDPNAGWGLIMLIVGVAWWMTRRRV